MSEIHRNEFPAWKDSKNSSGALPKPWPNFPMAPQNPNFPSPQIPSNPFPNFPLYPQAPPPNNPSLPPPTTVKEKLNSPSSLLEMYVRPSLSMCAFVSFACLLLFLFFDYSMPASFVFAIFILGARWVTIWLRLVFCAICFYYVGEHTYLVFRIIQFLD